MYMVHIVEKSSLVHSNKELLAVVLLHAYTLTHNLTCCRFNTHNAECMTSHTAQS